MNVKENVKPINSMTDNELREWWLSLTNSFKYVLLNSEVFDNLSIYSNDEINQIQNFVRDRENFDKKTQNEWLETEILWKGISSLRRIEKLSLSSYVCGSSKRIESFDDISPLAHFTHLRELDLSLNRLKDISALAHLTELRELNLQKNRIEDISALAHLTELRELYLQSNFIDDISPLANLVKLTGLFLSNNCIDDVSSLSDLLELKELYIDDNYIDDISSIDNLTQLKTLYIDLMGESIHSDADELLHLYPNLSTLYIAGECIMEDPNDLISLERLL